MRFAFFFFCTFFFQNGDLLYSHQGALKKKSITPQPRDESTHLPVPEPEVPTQPILPQKSQGSPNRPYIGSIGQNLEGEVIDVILCKGERGFGFTIVGGDEPGEMIQINAIVASGNIPERSGKHHSTTLVIIYPIWCLLVYKIYSRGGRAN